MSFSNRLNVSTLNLKYSFDILLSGQTRSKNVIWVLGFSNKQSRNIHGATSKVISMFKYKAENNNMYDSIVDFSNTISDHKSHCVIKRILLDIRCLSISFTTTVDCFDVSVGFEWDIVLVCICSWWWEWLGQGGENGWGHFVFVLLAVVFVLRRQIARLNKSFDFKL